MTDFKRGDWVIYNGKYSYFEGVFLNYIDKREWISPDGIVHTGERSCNVQQSDTGIVFVKPVPTEENRG